MVEMFESEFSSLRSMRGGETAIAETPLALDDDDGDGVDGDQRQKNSVSGLASSHF